MTITRAVFAVLVKMSGNTMDFSVLIEDFNDEMEILEGEGLSREKAIFGILRDMPGADKIISLWINATKMRKWYQTEKITIADKATDLFKE
jgi:hypothetical protein